MLSPRLRTLIPALSVLAGAVLFAAARFFPLFSHPFRCPLGAACLLPQPPSVPYLDPTLSLIFSLLALALLGLAFLVRPGHIPLALLLVPSALSFLGLIASTWINWPFSIGLGLPLAGFGSLLMTLGSFSLLMRPPHLPHT